MEENQSNTYTYPAKRHEEVESIRRKYMAKDADKMEAITTTKLSKSFNGRCFLLLQRTI
ncbi:MAG: hypothetical protein PHR92_12605 [Lachnospiraceae bacterium]|nr:hypothetical protein [Lachnospiraceae bacterium]